MVCTLTCLSWLKLVWFLLLSGCIPIIMVNPLPIPYKGKRVAVAERLKKWMVAPVNAVETGAGETPEVPQCKQQILCEMAEQCEVDLTWPLNKGSNCITCCLPMQTSLQIRMMGWGEQIMLSTPSTWVIIHPSGNPIGDCQHAKGSWLNN